MELDEEKLEALRSWGERLQQGDGDESAAAGRAILMLVGEIDRLQIALSHARIQPAVGQPVATERTAVGEEEPVALRLHKRLQRALQRDATAEAVEEPGRIWFPDGRAQVLQLLEKPKRGAELRALGVRTSAWVVSDVRPSGSEDLLYDVWVEAASA